MVTSHIGRMDEARSGLDLMLKLAERYLQIFDGLICQGCIEHLLPHQLTCISQSSALR